MYTVYTYLLYLAVSVPVALWVGWTLHRSGRTFLLEIFQGKEDLADSVNHLLVVGYYLVSIGFVTLSLQYGGEPDNVVGAIKSLSTKVGVVLFVLGGCHFLNLLLLSRLRWRVRLEAPPDPSIGSGGPGEFYGVERRVPPVGPEERLTRAGGPGAHDLSHPQRPEHL